MEDMITSVMDLLKNPDELAKNIEDMDMTNLPDPNELIKKLSSEMGSSIEPEMLMNQMKNMMESGDGSEFDPSKMLKNMMGGNGNASNMLKNMMGDGGLDPSKMLDMMGDGDFDPSKMLSKLMNNTKTNDVPLTQEQILEMEEFYSKLII
jgi:hypothetical protein